MPQPIILSVAMRMYSSRRHGQEQRSDNEKAKKWAMSVVGCRLRK